MEMTWSFNTTLRNPERMENMLRALLELEGSDFDLKGQEKFFGVQIKKRLYKPTNRILEELDLIEAVNAKDSADDLDETIVERILEKYRNRNVDGSARGRTAAGILNRFGLCIALQSRGKVVVTELGKKWLEHEIDDEELFTKFYLKWQYPNSIEGGYASFDVKPFVATLALIDAVNKKWLELDNKPVGLSKTEYQLFVPSLTNAAQIQSYANRIINFRKEQKSISGKTRDLYIRNFSEQRSREVYPSKTPRVVLNDFRDYCDSSIRYFRMSGLVALRGNGRYIDIAKDKEVEVKSLLETISANANKFDSSEGYFEYISDINSLDLPWQNEKDLLAISQNLSNIIKSEFGEDILSDTVSKNSHLPIKKQVEIFGRELNYFRIQKLRELRHDLVILDECIEKLTSITSRNYEALTARPSLDFEWFVSRALMVVNDAIEISPSFTLGDDGIPMGFRSNISDIECYYESFGMTVEVTLLLGRDQWIAEGQPVMRHLRDFEDKLDSSKKGYCLFVAPFIHRDTLNTFWYSNSDFGFEGKKQNIIPFNLSQFVKLLTYCRIKISENNLNQAHLQNLLNLILEDAKNTSIPQDWLDNVPTIVESWATDKPS